MSTVSMNCIVDHDRSIVVFTRNLDVMVLIESQDDIDKYTNDDFVILDHTDVRSSWMMVLTLYADFNTRIQWRDSYVQYITQPMCNIYKEQHLSEILSANQMNQIRDGRYTQLGGILLMRGVDPSFIRCTSTEVADMVCSVDSRYIDVGSDLFKTSLVELLKRVAKEKLRLRCTNDHDVDYDVDHEADHEADHDVIHHGGRTRKSFKCTACGSSFKDGYHLRRHENTKKHRRNAGLTP